MSFWVDKTTRFSSYILINSRTRKEDENLTLRCLHYEQEIGLLKKLLNEKQDLVNDLNAEKRSAVRTTLSFGL